MKKEISAWLHELLEHTTPHVGRDDKLINVSMRQSRKLALMESMICNKIEELEN